jgi:hypothetical protein
MQSGKKRKERDDDAVPATTKQDGKPDESKFPELADVIKIQGQLDAIEETETKAVVEVQRKFAAQKTPVYKVRNDKIKTIPDFWLKCFENHPTFSRMLNDGDKQILKSMQTLDFDDDLEKTFKITFGFKENSIFKNKTLSKEFHGDHSGPLKVVSSKVEWKDASFPEKNDHSFFVSLMDEDGPQAENIVADIRDSLFKSPIDCYTGAIVDQWDLLGEGDEGDEGEGGEGGGDGGDGGDGGPDGAEGDVGGDAPEED